MKKFILLISIIFCARLSFAQNKDSLTLKDLEIPNSPGFIILDQAPTSIERPNSTKAFAVGIFSNFGESKGFPQNYGIEFTPFWFFKHRYTTNVGKYIGINREKKVTSSLNTASISMAFINKTDTVTNKPINNIAFGVRTNILKIYSRKQREEVFSVIEKTIKNLKKIDSIADKAGATNQLLIDNPNEYRRIKKVILDSLQTELDKDTVLYLRNAFKIRPIFAIDAASAYNTFFINNDYSTNRFGRLGAWVTLNYSQNLNSEASEKSDYFNLYFVARYLKDGTIKNKQDSYITQEFFDVGGKIELEFKKISFGYEFISRNNKESNTYRSTGLIKYKIDDSLYLTGSFGRNFGNSNNLISLLGINWGLSKGIEKIK